MKLASHITSFPEAVGCGSVEMYSEFSLQYELGIYLRQSLKECILPLI